MKRNTFGILCICICIALMSSLFVACGNTENNNAGGTESAKIDTTAAESSQAGEMLPVYPVKTTEKLTYLLFLSGSVTSHFTNLSETPYAKELQKRTGIEVEYINPTDTDQFNVMVASGDLPDLISWSWETYYPGGATKALSDGVIKPLNDYMKDYAPNYSAYLAANEDINKGVKTSEGQYLYFPAVDAGNAMYGPLLRKDWLDDLGLKVPETVDEWYEVLKAFKDKKGAIAPFTNHSPKDYAFIVGAYGVKGNFFLQDGKVKYGPAEENYKSYLQTLIKFYNEGLIDKDIATVDGKLKAARITSGQSGATMGYPSSFITYTAGGIEKDPKFSLAPAPYPVLNKGEKPQFANVSLPYILATQGVAISTKCKNPELACRLMDYNYSEEGQLLSNFGIEGETYTVEADGTFKFTDKVLKNPDGWSMFDMLGAYALSYASGPYVRHPALTKAQLTLPIQYEASQIWSDTDALKHEVPPIRPNAIETELMNRIMADVRVYQDEMFLKFLFGDESIDNFSKYIEQMKALGIDRVLEIQQQAYDVYLTK